MSLESAAALLRQYRNFNNKRIDKRADDADSDITYDTTGEGIKFGTFSYLNRYDALYNEYKSNRNFNIDMWRNAFKTGEQDTYISLLDFNQDTEMSSQFYSPAYYNYEAMMLELYKPLADNTNKTERFTQVLDDQGRWVEASLGEMTDREYIQYQLDETYKYRTKEIEYELDQIRKDNMSTAEKVGHTIAGTLAEFGEGVLSALAGVADFIASPFYATAMATTGENWLDAYVEYYTVGATAAEKNTVRNMLDEYERTHTYIRDLDGNYTTVGKYLAGISNSIGMMIPSIVLNAVTGGGYGIVGMGSFYAAIYSSNLYENATNANTVDSPSWLKVTNAIFTSATEAVIEYALGKLLGGTIPNQLLGVAGKGTVKNIVKGLTRASGWAYLAKSAAQEGLEEFLQDFSTNLVNQFTGMIYEGYEKTGVTFQTLVDSFVMGAAASIFMSGGAVAANKAKSAVTRGRSDLYITVNGTSQRVGGLRRLYLSSILADFNEAVSTLKNEHVNVDKNVELAQQVYTAFSTFAQMFSGYDQKRIENAQRLLQRVIDSEQVDTSIMGASYTKFSDVTVANLQEGVSQQTLINQFADTIANEFKIMVGSAGIKGSIDKQAEKVKKAAKKHSKKLRENGVTELKAAANKNGESYSGDDAVLEEFRAALKPSENDLFKDYEWVFGTDGHVAIEEGDMLFVPVEWLKNYSKSDIYKFLAQEQILDKLQSTSILKPLWKEVLAYDKKVSGRHNISQERAIMDFLFNDTVFGGFLLSQNGKNLHNFKELIFNVNDLVRRLGQQNKLTQERKNYLQQIVDKIKDGWRKPTIKAILNWNMNAQEIGADVILNDADRQFINQYQTKRKLAQQGAKGHVSSSYKEHADLLVNQITNEKAKALVQRVLNEEPNITNEERTEAFAILNYVDYKASQTSQDNVYKAVDFIEVDIDSFTYVLDRTDTYKHKINKWYDDINARTNTLKRDINTIKERYNIFSTKLNSAVAILNNILANRTEPLEIMVRAVSEQVIPVLNKAIQEIKTIAKSSLSQDSKYNKSFVIPVEALFTLNLNKADVIQAAADGLNRFERDFGISASILFNITNSDKFINLLSTQALAKVRNVLEANNLNILYANAEDIKRVFINVLESYLGPQFAVTYKTDNNALKIVTKIPANELFRDDLIYDDIETSNRVLRNFIPPQGIKLNELLRIDNSSFIYDFLSNITVKFSNIYGNGYYDNDAKEIIISRNPDIDVAQTLVHEINHTVQNYYNLSGGFNNIIAEDMPDFLWHVMMNYSDYVNEVCGGDIQQYLRDIIKRHSAYFEQTGITQDALLNYLKQNDLNTYSRIAWAAYSLVQGELYAQYYEHNGRIVKGYINDGKRYIYSPDHKIRFELPASVQSNDSLSKQFSAKLPPSDAVAQSNLASAFENAMDAYNFGSIDNDLVRQTYHTALTRYSASALLDSIITTDLSPDLLLKTMIDDVIRDPQSFLTDEMLQRLNDDYTEGNVYATLREYFENTYDDVSIDRDANTHKYYFVDDNAFDDLMYNAIARKAQDEEGRDLVEKYTSDEGVNLNNFYNVGQLARLGIPSDVKVIINENVISETVIDKQHPNGLITIHIDNSTTNSELMNKLNHEFRHLMQYYNGLESGFTTNFKVTPAMVADIKVHVPEIFEYQDLILDAKLRNQDPDTYIARNFVYFLTGGELNAYGVKASLVNIKPVFVNVEAGKPTIFMPWYDAKTGEGRYKTEFLAQRAVDDKGPKHTSGRNKIPEIDKPKKNIGVTREDTGKTDKTGAPIIKRRYKYTNNRYFTWEEAKGTNLKYFYKKNTHNQMDPDLQNFVKQSTGHDDELPKEIVYAIKRRKLTKQSLFKWFRTVSLDSINDYTFNLLNRTMFKNSTITSTEQLKKLVEVDTSFWWAAAIVLKSAGLEGEYFLSENSVDKFLEVITKVENSNLLKRINELREKNYNTYYLTNKKNGKKYKVKLGTDAKYIEWLRVTAMQYFDGTLAGAFYVANTLRKTVANQYLEERQKKSEASLDVAYGAEDGATLGESLSDDGLTPDTKDIGNNILALYEQEISMVDIDEMMAELGKAAEARYRRKFTAQAKKAPQLKDKSAAFKRNLIDKAVREQMTKYVQKLTKLDADEIERRFMALREEQLTGIQSSIDYAQQRKLSDSRTIIVSRIKSYANKLLDLVSEGKVIWEYLPKRVQDMFEIGKIKKCGITYKGRILKPEVYSVGRGAVKGERTFIGNQNLAHDTTKIIENRDLLKRVVADANANVFATREAATRMSKAEQELAAERRKKQRELNKKVKKVISDDVQTRKEAKEVEFNVKKRKRTNDTPNYFTVNSEVTMPEIVKSLFNTSFESMANTQVQFASKDESGKLYEKGDKEFDSRLKHEVSNWDAFYEANRQTLLNMTRKDALDIVDFIHNGNAFTFDGPINKLYAFQLFTLGYIISAARADLNSWNFSDAEIDNFIQLYEYIASAYGSGLNAAKQMLSVINPYKKVQQHFLEDYNITEEELKPLYSALDDLQAARTVEDIKSKTTDVAQEMRKLEERMIEGDTRPKGFGKRWYDKLKSFRYTSMLSSPMTWVRNIVSNVVQFVFTGAANKLSNFVFMGKNYREDQWDLTHTKIDPEVKTFIDNNILKSELFEVLYDTTTKYDERKKNVTRQKELFVQMITTALEQKYAANHRFDSKTMNMIARFVNSRISDKRFIKFVAGRYLGKILTIEKNAGNVSLDNGLSNEVLNLFAEAVILANMDYMHKRSFLADMLDGIRDKHPVAYEVLNWWQPFMNSSFNWFGEFLKYTPVGMVRAIYNMIKLEKQIQKLDERRARHESVPSSRAAEYLARRDIGKGMVGLILMGLGIILGLTGVLKIEDDDDKFYMTIGDAKIDISNVFGSSSVLIGAALTMIGRDEDENGEADYDFNDIMGSIGNILTEGFLLKDILDRHKWDNGMWEAMLTETESILRSFVPQFVQLFVRITNNQEIQYSSGVMGMFERWLNTFVPIQPFGTREVDPYTGEIRSKYAIPIFGELLKGGLFGPNIFWYYVSDEEKFAKEYDVNKGQLTGQITVNGEKYELEDSVQLNQKYGQLNKESLAEIQKERHLIEMPDGTFKTLPWNKLSDEQKANVISRTMEQNATIAKIWYWTQILDKKYYANNSLWQALRKLGITSNVYKGDKGYIE